MAKSTMNLQDSFLNQARKQNITVTVELSNGEKLKGKVSGFDSFTVIIDTGKIPHLIYKHAISSISPEKPFELKSSKKNKDKDQPPSKEQIEEFKKVMENKSSV